MRSYIRTYDVRKTNWKKYIPLINQCAVRTVSYVSSPYDPSAKRAGYKKSGANEDS